LHWTITLTSFIKGPDKAIILEKTTEMKNGPKNTRRGEHNSYSLSIQEISARGGGRRSHRAMKIEKKNGGRLKEGRFGVRERPII